MSQVRFTDNSENELYSAKNLNGKSAAITKNAGFRITSVGGRYSY